MLEFTQRRDDELVHRDKYFHQLRTKIINPVGEPHRTSLTVPAHTKANTYTQRDQGGCQSPPTVICKDQIS